jgi:hypothetical protein
MTISLRVVGTATASGAAVNAINPAVGAGATASDISLLGVVVKPYTATITTPSGWTKIGESTSGTTASGADSGSVKTAIYYKIGALDGETTGNIGSSGANTMHAGIVTYQHTGAGWDILAAFGAMGTPDTAYSATMTSAIPVAAGDQIVAFTGLSSDGGTRSSASFTGWSGATQSGATGLHSTGTSTGDDCGLYDRDVEITAGSSTGTPPVFSFTNTTTIQGVTGIVRLRESTAILRASTELVVTAARTATGRMDAQQGSTALVVTAAVSADEQKGLVSGAALALATDTVPSTTTPYTSGSTLPLATSVTASGTAGSPPANVTAILTGFEVLSPVIEAATAVLTAFEAMGVGTVGGATAILTGFEAMGHNDNLVAVLSGPTAVEPAEVFTLSTASSAGNPTTVSVVQLTGPSVGLGGSGTTWAGTAPFVLPSPTDTPTMATFRVTIGDGIGTDTADWSVEIYPHTIWRRSGSVLQPVKIPADATATLEFQGPSNRPSITVTRYAGGVVGNITPPPPPPPPNAAAFVHPGIMLSQEMMDFTAANIGSSPWSGRFSTLMSRTNDVDTVYNGGLAYSSLSWTPHPSAQPTSASGSSGRAQLISDGMAAWIDTLAWVYNGDRARANKAADIVNAWMHTITSIPFNSSNVPAGTSDGRLLSGWTAELFTRTAEVLRYTWNPVATGSDTQLDVDACIDKFTNVWYPNVYQGWTGGGANWLTTMAAATIQIGVFCDRRDFFQVGIDNWRSWVSAYAFRPGDVNKHTQLANLPHAAKGTNFDTDTASRTTYMSAEWDSPYPTPPWPGYIWAETGRDDFHYAMGFGSVFNGAETAWHQGVDLYAEQQGRIVPTMEKLARIITDSHLDGQNPPPDYAAVWSGSISIVNTSSPRATFEGFYNHYNGRLGISMPDSLDMLTRFNRPSTYVANLMLTGEAVTHRANTAGATFVEPMPVGDEEGWQQVTAVDFTTAVAIGGFVPNQDGVLTTAGLAGYNAYGPGRPGGPLLEMYPDGWHTNPAGGIYAPAQVVSVKTDVKGANGVLDFWCRNVTIGAETLPGSAVVHPISVIGNPRRIGPYFKYGFRLRCIGFAGTGYAVVPLTIDSNNWPEYGELDWPEADCVEGGKVTGYYHRADPAGSQQAIPNDGGRNRISDWHTYWVESLPGRVNFYLDDALMLTSTTLTPTQALYFVLQSGAGGNPAASTSGHIQFDWVVAYNQAPITSGAALMHYDADSLTGANGSAVSSWPDISASGVSGPLVQNNTATQPTLAVDAVNGHNAVVWGDGVNRIMSVSGAGADVFRNKATSMVFIAFTLSSAVTTGICNLFGASTPAGTNRVMLQARGTTGFVAAGGRRLDTDALRTFSTSAAATRNVPHILTVRYLWSSAIMYVYLDGVLIGTDNPYQTAGATSDTAALQTYVGASVTGNADYHHGQIMEIMVWDRDNAGTRSSVEAAWKAKYGIA